MTSIEAYAFSGCISLAGIAIPGGVTSIGERTFWGCNALTDITFQGTMAQWDAMSKDSGWEQGILTTVVHCIDGDVPME